VIKLMQKIGIVYKYPEWFKIVKKALEELNKIDI
jgi:hypothetical protein